jgi:Na+/melibiose symporter-like transporter
MPTRRLSRFRRADSASGARIGRFSLAAFTLPVLLFQAIEMTWRAYLPRFLHQDVGIALATIAALMMGARLLDAVADLLLGWISDTVDTPMGRRKPWMAAGALLVAIGAPPLFMAPMGTALTTIVGASLLLHIGYSLIITPHGGWGLELSVDSHQRTRIMGAKVWFGLLGSLGLLGILAVLERVFAVSLRTEMHLLGWAIAVLAPLTVLVPILLFRERVRPAYIALTNPIRLLNSVLGKPAIRPILLLYMVTGIADAAAASSFLFLTEDALALHHWGAALMLIPPVAAMVALPFWGRLSARMDRRHILMFSYGWQAVCATALMLVPSGAMRAFAAILAIKGLGWGVDFMLLRAMVADVAGEDADTAPLAASFYGVSSIALKLAMGLGGGGALWAIGWAGDDMPGLAIRVIHCGPTMAAALGAACILRMRRDCGSKPATSLRPTIVH